MRKKDIIAMLSLMMISGFTVRDIHDYNSQSQALLEQKVDLEEYKTIYEKVNEMVDECEENKREEYVQQKVEELRAEKERIRLEEERKRQEEEERRKQEELRRQQEEQQRLQQEQTSQVVNRGGEVPCGRAVRIEVSHYCSCSKCCAGATGITASGKRVSEGMIACPSSIPFGTKILIDGVTYTCEDTGSYIKFTQDGTMRVDIYVSSHSEALRRGRYITTGYILD